MRFDFAMLVMRAAIASVLMIGADAYAEEATEETRRDWIRGVMVGAGPLVQLYSLGPNRDRASTTAWLVEAAQEIAIVGSWLDAELGARAGFGEYVSGGLGLEVFGRAAMAADLPGRWQPRIAVELGLSSLHTPEADDASAPGSVYRELSRPGPAYVGTALAPARFRIGRYRLEIGSLLIGTTLPRWGRSVRLQLAAARLGARF